MASEVGVAERGSPLVRPDAEWDKMKALLKQRDDEISIHTMLFRSHSSSTVLTCGVRCGLMWCDVGGEVWCGVVWEVSCVPACLAVLSSL